MQLDGKIEDPNLVMNVLNMYKILCEPQLKGFANRL